MRTRTLLIFVLVVLSTAQGSYGRIQSNPTRALLVQALEARGLTLNFDAWPVRDAPYYELRVRAQSATLTKEQLFDGGSQENTAVFSLINASYREEGLQIVRSANLSPFSVLVAGVTSTNEVRWLTLVTDPRQVSAEYIDEGGALHKELSVAQDVEFFVAVPDDPLISQLRFYFPMHTDNGVTLHWIGTLGSVK